MLQYSYYSPIVQINHADSGANKAFYRSALIKTWGGDLLSTKELENSKKNLLINEIMKIQNEEMIRMIYYFTLNFKH